MKKLNKKELGTKLKANQKDKVFGGGGTPIKKGDIKVPKRK